MKHTPGPWHATDEDTVVGPSGNIVADCCGYSIHATDPAQLAQGGREANALLIAAAPDLLATLEMVAGMLDTFPGFDSRAMPIVDRPCGSIGCEVRAAIARATGGE